MNAETRTEIGIGLAKLADAVHHLRSAQADVEKALPKARPGSDVETIALGLARVMAHLSEAVGDVPIAMWAAMLSEKSVGIEEIRKAIEAQAA